MAKLLSLSVIPCHVRARHADWQKIRQTILRQSLLTEAALATVPCRATFIANSWGIPTWPICTFRTNEEGRMTGHAQAVKSWLGQVLEGSAVLKGIVLGGIIGGVVSLMDSNTRNSVKEAAKGLKSSSQTLLTEVKENPEDLKEQMINQFREASNILKDAIGDAQTLYERVNTDLFSKVGDVKELTNTAMTTVKDAKGEIAQIGSKVADAGAELKGVTSPTTSSTSTLDTTNSVTSSSSYDTTGTSSYGTVTGSYGRLLTQLEQTQLLRIVPKPLTT